MIISRQQLANIAVHQEHYETVEVDNIKNALRTTDWSRVSGTHTAEKAAHKGNTAANTRHTAAHIA